MNVVGASRDDAETPEESPREEPKATHTNTGSQALRPRVSVDQRQASVVERWNNTSVGILVQRDYRLLLIERRKPPYGWAPPAGHVDDGETYEQAAERELFEEVGLQAQGLRHLLTRRYENRCRRPGGHHHNWQIFEAVCDGEPVRSEDETSAMRWFTRSELDELSQRSIAHLANSADPSQWRDAPGLEPVWMNMLAEIADKKCDCCPDGR